MKKASLVFIVFFFLFFSQAGFSQLIFNIDYDKYQSIKYGLKCKGDNFNEECKEIFYNALVKAFKNQKEMERMQKFIEERVKEVNERLKHNRDILED